MSIGQDFRAYLKTSNLVMSLLASPDAIYPQFLPAKRNYPALTYAQDANDDIGLLEGSNSGLHTALISVDVWHYDYILSHRIADALRTVLVGYRGAFGSVTVDKIRCDRELDLYEYDTGLNRVSLQFFIAYG